MTVRKLRVQARTPPPFQGSGFRVQGFNEESFVDTNTPSLYYMRF